MTGEGNLRALHHGARSERVVRKVATVQKRRLLRQIGLRAADLSGLALAYLDQWARAQAKVELMDAWLAEHGLVREDGSLPGLMATYLASLNSARLALSKFEDELRTIRSQRRGAAVDLAQYRKAGA